MKLEKKQSVHNQLITFFSDTALATRGFRPQITAKDAQQLKRAINLNIFSQIRFEQIILYFLADKSFRNLGPSIATMLSSTVLNSLRNKALNRNEFYKEVFLYSSRYISRTTFVNEPGFKGLPDMLANLSAQLSYSKANAPRAPVEKRAVGLFESIKN